MKKVLALLVLLLSIMVSFAQNHDAVWCFGDGAGIDFSDTSNIQIFESNTDNDEMNVSFSDSAGNLIFYLKSMNQTDSTQVINGGLLSVVNSDGLKAHASMTNGAIIIPDGYNGNVYYIFHLNLESSLQCLGWVKLYRTTIEELPNGNLVIKEKNKLISTLHHEEKLAAIKHANGKDWWLLSHANNCEVDSFNNDFYKFYIQGNKVSGPFIQSIGKGFRGIFFGQGEMTFSRNGNFLATTALTLDTSYVEVFNFDRCNSFLSTKVILTYDSLEFSPYGCEFSPNEQFIYISSGAKGAFSKNIVYQYDLSSIDMLGQPDVIWLDSTVNVFSGQLELAPNNKIYLAGAFGSSFPNNDFTMFNQNLGVIHSPDSLGAACDFQPFSFFLGDSARVIVGLPNMPNYNVEAIAASIWDASAANQDTLVFCTDTTWKGLILGVDSVAGVSYSWSPNIGLDNDSIAQPFLDPDVSRWYYVTLTDTSINYSCQQRVDSVFIEVKECYTSIWEPSRNDTDYRLIPNLLKDQWSVSISIGAEERGRVEIYSLTGVLTDEFEVESGSNKLELTRSNYSTGMYIYKVWVDNELKNSDKLVLLK